MHNQRPSGSGIEELQPGEAGDDPLDLKYGGEAVRDDEHRAAIHDAVENLLDEALALRVERTRRLSTEKQGQGASAPASDADRDTRPPSARNTQDALAEICAVTLRQTLDRLHRRRGGRRPADFRFRRPGTAMAEVVDHISGEEHGALRHRAYRHPNLSQVRVMKVDPV